MKKFKCLSCSILFNIGTLPYELPCEHIYCLQCLEKCVITNYDGIICNLCEKIFDLTIKKVPISKIYLKIISEKNSEKKISCNLHPKKKLKYLNRKKQEFYCSLCILKQNYEHNELINYSESNFFEDLDQIEIKLLDLQKSLSEKFKQINILKNTNFLGLDFVQSKMQILLKFLEKPIDNNINLYYFLNSNNVEFSKVLKDDTFPDFSSSEILKNHENRYFLQECFPKEKIKFLENIFIASEYNFKSEHFHFECDNRGPTLVVIRSKNGNVFGGYATKSWNVFGEINAQKSFIFQLDYKTKHEQFCNFDSSLYCDWDYNPTFGGACDLYLSDECNKVNNKYCSRSELGSTYSINSSLNSKNEILTNSSEKSENSEKASCYLAGSHEFLVDEFEVFTIIWDD